MSDMIAIHADIIKVGKKFVTVRCGDAEEVLNAGEIEADEPLEAGQVNMQLRVLRATAEALGLSDADEPRRATITEFNPAPDPDATLDITLTILTFSEDGETATVEDRHGNTADISTADFTHDADEIRAGDTLLCHVLTSAVEPTDLCPNETPEEEGEENASPSGGHGSTWLRKDTCAKSFPLSDDEKLELGNAMAKAQERIDELESELAGIRKSYKFRIEAQQKILSQAAKEYRDGKTEPVTVECDVFQDWKTDELVYVTADEAAEEIMRRPMTDEEKRPTLFGAPPDAKVHSAPKDPRHTGAEPMPQTWGHTCVDCAHMADGQDGAQAEECSTCVQSNSGNADNWEPRRECATCNYKTMTVHMPPCNVCLRNVEERYRGDDDNWVWAGPKTAENASEAAPEAEEGVDLNEGAEAVDVPPASEPDQPEAALQ